MQWLRLAKPSTESWTMVAPRSAHQTHAPEALLLHVHLRLLLLTGPQGAVPAGDMKYRNNSMDTPRADMPATPHLHRRPLFDLSCLRLSCSPRILDLHAIAFAPSSNPSSLPRHVIVSRPLRHPTNYQLHHPPPATLACHLRYAGLEATARGHCRRSGIATILSRVTPSAHTLSCIYPVTLPFCF